MLSAAAAASVACSTLLGLGDYSVQTDGGPVSAGEDASDEAAVNPGTMDGGGAIQEASVDAPARGSCDVDSPSPVLPVRRDVAGSAPQRVHLRDVRRVRRHPAAREPLAGRSPPAAAGDLADRRGWPMKRGTRRAPALAVAAWMAGMATTSQAHAIACDSIPNATAPDGGVTPTIYIEGAAAVAPFLAPLQQALSVDPSPINLIYVGDGGCLGANDFFTNTPIPKKPAAVFYAGESRGTCDLPTGSGGQRAPPVADIAASDVYAPSCGTLPGGQLPPHVGDFLGPIQTMAFVVPVASMQKALSAKGAYFVFGFGPGSGVAPWTVNASIYRRNEASAVQALLASAIGVPLPRWFGVDASTLLENADAGLTGGSAVANALENDPNPEQAIGILSDTDIDANASTTCACWPTRTTTRGAPTTPTRRPGRATRRTSATATTRSGDRRTSSRTSTAAASLRIRSSGG